MGQYVEGQLSIPGMGGAALYVDDGFPPLPPTGDVPSPQVHSAGWGLTGICLGSPGCLCGQRELSDDPLWNESD